MIIIGVGNPFRRDDAAGVAVARRLRGTLPAGGRILEREGDLASLLEAWGAADEVVIIDAMSSGATPGTIRRFDAQARRLPAGFARGSTHAFGVAEALDLARALGRLPARVVVYGIEGRDFAAGEGLSPEVAAAVDEVARRVALETTARA